MLYLVSSFPRRLWIKKFHNTALLHICSGNLLPYLMLSLGAVVVMSLTPAKGGAGEHDSTVPNCVSGTKPVFFFCSAPHADRATARPRSLIRILHCKQSGCTQFSCTPRNWNIALIGHGPKMRLCLRGRQSDCSTPSPGETSHPRPADSEDERGPVSCYVLCKILQSPEKK